VEVPAVPLMTAPSAFSGSDAAGSPRSLVLTLVDVHVASTRPNKEPVFRASTGMRLWNDARSWLTSLSK
jgi:hypothetical protein